jgi:hypothetical protein
MTHARGRRLAWLSAALGAGLLIAAVMLGRDAIVERYWLFRLGSADEATMHVAAARLGELRSVAAVPRLLDLLRTRSEEQVLWSRPVVVPASPRQAARTTAFKWLSPMDPGQRFEMTPVPLALHHIGEPALPAIEAAIELATASAGSEVHVLATLTRLRIAILTPAATVVPSPRLPAGVFRGSARATTP